MGWDIYSLIKSSEVREYFMKNRKFTPLEQEVIIRNSYYSIEQKLEFMKKLLQETISQGQLPEKEIEILAEKVSLYEYVINFIYKPEITVIYMAKEETCGYNVYNKNNHFRLSEKIYSDTYYFRDFESLRKYWEHNTNSEYTVSVDIVLLKQLNICYNEGRTIKPVQFYMRISKDGKMSIQSFKMDEDWFINRGFSEVSVYNDGSFRCVLPFERGSRVKLQTPDMREAVFGIMDNYWDKNGLYNQLLWIEDEEHDFEHLRKLLEEQRLDYREVDVIDVSYPVLNMCSRFLSYDWVERSYVYK